jgi:hypothetical protein
MNEELVRRFIRWCGAGMAIVLGAQTCPATSWQIERSINLGSSNVVQVLADPVRPYVYAIDQGNNQVLFIDLNAGVVTNRLYIGQDPTSCDIDATTNYLYVGNKSTGTGLPGSYQIAVIDLGTQTKTNYYVLSTDYINESVVDAINVTAGRNGRLYYNSGNDIWNYGASGSIDTTTGTDLGLFDTIKTRMVISSDKSRLYGQRIYTGNLGEMGDFDVSTDDIQLVDQLQYPPYGSNYGWGPDNYTLSGNNLYLAFGDVYFNATNLVVQYGVFSEYIYALNYDGTVAFGESAIWDPTTFAVNGTATKLQDLPFPTTVMTYDSAHDLLYLMNPADSTLYILSASNCSISISNSPPAGGLSSGGGTYAPGVTVTVTATPNTGYWFWNWTESGTNVSYANSYSFGASGDRNLVANFVHVPAAFYTWQMQYFGCTNCPKAAANADPDGVGQNNLAQFLAGTNPTNPATSFRILQIVPSGEDILLTWTAVGGKQYVIERATPVDGSYSNGWTDLDPIIIVPGSGPTTMSVIDPGAAARGPSLLYRIRLVPQLP